MSDAERGQVAASAAELYDEFFLPALFAQWSGRVADAAEIAPGNDVLDVACGTGVLAREAAERVGDDGSVVGVDVNDGMLSVARRNGPDLEWRHGTAEALPFDDGVFDRVVSQFGLMFFEDRSRAIAEMRRVLRPGGRVAVAVWDRLDESPGYEAMVSLLDRIFGDEAADALRAPFTLGDEDELTALFADAFPDARVHRVEGTARFPSIADWVRTDVRAWTLADMIDDAQLAVLQDAAQQELTPFETADGSVEFDSPALIVTSAAPI